MSDPEITVVIPTVGRATLRAVAEAVPGRFPLIVVDDRADPGAGPLPVGEPSATLVILPSGGRGPAAARNRGWRAASSEWVVFLDDDVLPGPGWAEKIGADLRALPPEVAGSQGRIVVPLDENRPPTDAERNTAGLAAARWITADMAFRRSALAAVGGFDERFPRAYREDADLALRLTAAGYRLVTGRRTTVHPVRDEGFWASVRRQRGNADDALMRRVHGPGWRSRVGGPGRLRDHLLTTALGLTAAVLAWRGRPAATAAFAGWAALTARFAWSRIAPGPRTPAEVLRMAATSVLIPPAACLHRLGGELRVRVKGGGACIRT
ncbi:glycosyltransferase family 2 protein [Herbidospora cretacea]|uniref:glycosyltransferase family 2 protein n=1 Tax=Herbidospora cretacea TaxID=28444 RepID=UPI00055355BE|nr:glycosyltransferase [Herbidospora cretacea]